MGKIGLQIRRDLKDLPLMLGKLLGGIAAVLGVTMTVLILTRQSGARSAEILGPLLLACAGLAGFYLSDRRLTGRSTVTVEESPSSGRSLMSVLSWALLLLVSGIFLAAVYLLTK